MWDHRPTADELLGARVARGWAATPTATVDGLVILVHAACRLRLTRTLALALALAGCPKTAPISAVDAPFIDADLAVDAPQPPYSDTIPLDGSNDFATGEAFPTTTAGYAADIAWDSDNIYIGYTGMDLETDTVDASTKWLFAYFDVDPGNATGALVTQTYNTQHATLPTGFGAELYFRWKCDGTFTTSELVQRQRCRRCG